MSGLHYAGTLRTFAELDPACVLLATPTDSITATQLYERSTALAGYLHRRGVTDGRPVAAMLFNRPAILESFFAALWLGSPPANINPRYTAAEIAEILRDCDAAALVYEPSAAAEVTKAVRMLDRDVILLDWSSTDYAEALTASPAPARSLYPADRLLWYTGGTTGRPRGVIWEVDTHYRMLWEVVRPQTDPPDPATVAADPAKRAPTTLPASPLAHGTAMGLALNTLNGGGTVVLHEDSGFDAAETLHLADRRRVRVLGIVGDAYARPLLDELSTGRWAGRLQDLAVISSSGAVWSPEVRAGLVSHLPQIRLIDNFGSTEALVSRDETGQGFQPRRGLVVLDDHDRPVQPGSGIVGVIATSERLPVGYLNDPEKTAQSFRMIEGVRHLIVGDHATVNSDGSIRILGRGNACINTGGEKVWPEEVEIVVRDHPAVLDAAIVGMPDERWGQRVVAVLETRPDCDIDDAELSAYCRERLTPYKCPKQWIRVKHVPRTYVGKPDYNAVRRVAAEFLGLSASGFSVASAARTGSMQ
jgi:fatty-acyl-CoA synthase